MCESADSETAGSSQQSANKKGRAIVSLDPNLRYPSFSDVVSLLSAQTPY